MSNWLERTNLLLGEEKLNKIKNSRVLIVGLGGVGAYAAEMIARGGVGYLTIVDSDTVSESNINRQLPALHSTIGQEKSKVLADRLLDINPDVKLNIITEYLSEDNIGSVLDAEHFDYVVDAIDTLTPKEMLIVESLSRGLQIVSSMGAGAKTDPTLVKITDISKSNYCPLAHALRKRLNRRGIRKGFKVVFSPEPVREGAMILCNEPNKKSNMGTISYMPPVFGCHCASVVLRGLIGEI